MKAGDTVRYSSELIRRWCRSRCFSAELLTHWRDLRMTIQEMKDGGDGVIVMDPNGAIWHGLTTILTVVE